MSIVLQASSQEAHKTHDGIMSDAVQTDYPKWRKKCAFFVCLASCIRYFVPTFLEVVSLLLEYRKRTAPLVMVRDFPSHLYSRQVPPAR